MKDVKFSSDVIAADEIHEGVQLAAGGFPYLRPGAVIMRQPVAIALELVGAEGGAFLRQRRRCLFHPLQIAAGHLARF